MKNKIKYAAAACIGCILFFGAAFTVFAAGMLSIAVSSGTVSAGDTVTVSVYALGANSEEVTADMSITYDSAKLEYISSSDSNATYGGGTVKARGSSVDIKFKAVASGDAYVKAEGATLTAAGTHIMVTGSQSADTSASDDDSGRTKSGDNSLSSLTISPGTLSPAFKGSVTEYTAQVGMDVSEISVAPVTSNKNATIVSITGNTGLKEGANVVTVLVKAENGTEASYKITVTKSESAPASTGSAGVSDMADIAAGQAKDEEDTEKEESASESMSPDAIQVDGVNYKISNDFTDEQIPQGFSRTNFEYKGTPCEGVVFDYGHLGMYYMVSEAGEGKFFIYDADRDKFYPYMRLSSGEHFIVLMVVPNGVIPPEGYEETTLTVTHSEESVTVSAYQYAGAKDEEIVVTEPGEEGAAGQKSDFYIFYGMDETGVSGWYQYDIKQATYQRFNQEFVVSSDDGDNYDSLLTSYNSLDERYKAAKTRTRNIIIVLIFVSVLLLIVVINLLFKIREVRAGDDEEEYERKPARNVRPKKPRRTSQESEEYGSFYDNDEEDIAREFEDSPKLFERKSQYKEKKKDLGKEDAKTYVSQQPAPPVQDDDDDFEFLDLNDL